MSDKTLAEAVSEAVKPCPARERLTALFDPDTFTELGALVKNGCDAAGVVTGWGKVGDVLVYAFAQDSTVKNGAVGAAHGAKIKKLYDLAVKTGAPLVGIYDSDGADLANGMDALAAYGDMISSASAISGVSPQISLVLGVCAGAAAILAASADFVIMSEKGEFYLSSGDASTASNAAQAAKSGVAHITGKDDAECVAAARQLLSMMPANNLEESPMCDFSAPQSAPQPLDMLRIKKDEANLLDVAGQVVDVDSVIELQASYAECGSRVALATIGGATIGLVATADKGFMSADGASKIARFVTICDSFAIPVITFVNCRGFAPVPASGFRGGVREAAKLAHVYAQATVPKLSVISGNAFGSAFIALCGHGVASDFSCAWAGATVSPLAPQTAVAFLEGAKITHDMTREQVEQAYIATQANPLTAVASGHIDEVIEPAATRETLLAALEMLANKRVSTLPKKHGNIPL